MELTEDEFIQKHAQLVFFRTKVTLKPNESEFTCVVCRYKFIKRKHQLSKISGKELNSINRLKQAELEINCICIDVYRVYEADDNDNCFEVLSRKKNEKIKVNKILIE